jgi:hypothetical protein
VWEKCGGAVFAFGVVDEPAVGLGDFKLGILEIKKITDFCIK